MLEGYRCVLNFEGSNAFQNRLPIDFSFDNASFLAENEVLGNDTRSSNDLSHREIGAFEHLLPIDVDTTGPVL